VTLSLSLTTARVGLALGLSVDAGGRVAAAWGLRLLRHQLSGGALVSDTGIATVTALAPVGAP
jgi:hypothetical protein